MLKKHAQMQYFSFFLGVLDCILLTLGLEQDCSDDHQEAIISKPFLASLS